MANPFRQLLKFGSMKIFCQKQRRATLLESSFLQRMLTLGHEPQTLRTSPLPLSRSWRVSPLFTLALRFFVIYLNTAVGFAHSSPSLWGLLASISSCLLFLSLGSRGLCSSTSSLKEQAPHCPTQVYWSCMPQFGQHYLLLCLKLFLTIGAQFVQK